MVVLLSGSWINNMLSFGGLFVTVSDLGAPVSFWSSLLPVFSCNTKTSKRPRTNTDKLLLLTRLNMSSNATTKREYIAMILIRWNRIPPRNKRFRVSVNERLRFFACKFHLIASPWKKTVYKTFTLLNGP